MKIIAHRGLWNNTLDQNTISSFTRAINLNCGIETDIRSLDGNLVVSHDLVSKASVSFESVLGRIAEDLISKKLPLCINIKEDGLQEMLVESIRPYPELDYVVFDASLPELFKYAQGNIPYLCRISEYEVWNKLFENCAGIWLDSLASNWITYEKLSEINSYKKRIFFVSPELHGRNYENVWEILKAVDFKAETFICTDKILEALEEFQTND